MSESYVDLVLGVRLDSELIEVVGTPMSIEWFRALTPDQAMDRLYRPMHAALRERLDRAVDGHRVVNPQTDATGEP